MRLYEISRMDRRHYTGGKDWLPTYSNDVFDMKMRMAKPLPGGSGWYYFVENTDYFCRIKIVDPNIKIDNWGSRDAIGALDLKKVVWPTPAMRVDVITTHEDYRGMGVAKALYGIALSILKVTLLAGDSQTPGGRRNWVSLSNIPGVDVMGYGKLEDDVFDTAGVDRREDALELITQAIVDVGADFIGTIKEYGEPYHIFVFPVTANPDQELQNAIDDAKFSVYGGEYPYAFAETGLMAKWTGQ